MSIPLSLATPGPSCHLPSQVTFTLIMVVLLSIALTIFCYYKGETLLQLPLTLCIGVLTRCFIAVYLGLLLFLLAPLSFCGASWHFGPDLLEQF